MSREHALAIWQAAVDAVRPEPLVEAALGKFDEIRQAKRDPRRRRGEGRARNGAGRGSRARGPARPRRGAGERPGRDDRAAPANSASRRASAGRQRAHAGGRGRCGGDAPAALVGRPGRCRDVPPLGRWLRSPAGSRGGNHARGQAGGDEAAPPLWSDDRRDELRPQTPVRGQGRPAGEPRSAAGFSCRSSSRT